MLSLVTVALVIASSSLTLGQSRTEWTPEQMYNPAIEPRKCGLNSDEPAYICDPNHLLGDDIHKINWVLKDAAYNSTKCPCSNWYCENQRGALGYRIKVALVRKMTLQPSLDGKRNTPIDQAQLFAYRLESTQWKAGNCEEDIVIFFSNDDKVLAINGGSTALLKLTENYRQILAYKVGERFNNGQIVEALNNLLYDLKLVLNCDSGSHDCGLTEIRGGAPVSTFSITVLFSSLLISLYTIVKH